LENRFNTMKKKKLTRAQKKLFGYLIDEENNRIRLKLEILAQKYVYKKTK